MRFRAVAVVVTCAMAIAASPAPQEPLRVGVAFDVPQAYVTPEGEPVGFYVDVFREAFRREGLPLKLIVGRTSPDRFLEGGAGEIWVAAVATPERRRKFHVTRPWWILETYLAVIKPGPVKSPGELGGKRVIYPDSPPFSVPLTTLLPGSLPTVENDVQARLTALCTGRVDGVVFHEPEVHRLLQAPEFAGCRNRGIRVISFDRPVRELSILADKQFAGLADRLQARIETMKRDGTIERFQSSRLTGNELWRSQLEEERRVSQQRLANLALCCAVVLLMGAGVAYLRLRTAHRRIRRSLDLAKEAVRAKQEFLAAMSHEIRTPMHSVLGASELLSLSPLDANQREYAETIHRSARGLLTLLNDVIDWSRIESGRFVLEEAAFDMQRLIDDVKASVAITARNKGLQLQFTAETATYKGDVGRLRQILLNLVSNAVKYTDHGFVWLHVRELSRDENRVLLRAEVKDTGVGISEQARKTLFQRFSRGDAASLPRYQGAGLGLAICKELAEQLGGTIGFESYPGKGSTFWFEVPVLAADEAALPAHDANESVETMPRRSILVVEDNDVNSLLIRRLLNRLGHEVEAAANGIEAIERMEAGGFDLVFMDCLMPEMDGYEATEIIRKRGNQIPIVALTASASEADRRRCLDAGMNGYLTKPVLLADLSLAVRRYAGIAGNQP